MIRAYFVDTDEDQIKKIHATNELPKQCLLDLGSPLVLYTGVVEIEKKVVMACSLRGTAELFLFVDHEAGTPEERWQWMQELKEHIVHEAWLLGLDQISAWIPGKLEKTFAPRLEEMGFIKSPWSCYTLAIEK